MVFVSPLTVDAQRVSPRRRHQQLLRVVGRTKAIGPAGEVALGQRGGRHVLDLGEAGLAGQRQHLRRREEADEGRAVCSRPAAARSIPGRTSGSAISIGSMNDMASVEPGASAATWRSVARIASLVRYMLTPVDATTAGRAGVEARRGQPLPPGVARLEVDGHEPQERRDAEAELDEALALPRLRAGLIDLEHEQAGGELRPTLGEGVEPRSEDDVLPDAPGRPARRRDLR